MNKLAVDGAVLASVSYITVEDTLALASYFELTAPNVVLWVSAFVAFARLFMLGHDLLKKYKGRE